MASNLPKPSPPPKPITMAIVGAGNRGSVYASFALHYPEWLRIVAICGHGASRCHQIAQRYSIPAEHVFVGDWSLLAAQPRLADTVAICTPDRDHVGPAQAFAGLGYHILLEKPMSAVSVDECLAVYNAVKEAGVMLAVAHVLRYTNYTRIMKQILDSGEIGQIVSVQHMEPVGFWHFTHSYVRGNWRRESESSFSLLAKSSHDIDLLCYLIGSHCKKISSFGNLLHFRRENKPPAAGTATNCLYCAHEPSCPYSAKKIYLEPLQREGVTGWPNSIVQPNGVIDIESLTDALRSAPYGLCVYESDNDVCDHQVVNMEFENGVTAAFTMVGFTEAMCERKTKIFGSRGELTGDGVDEIRIYDFLTRKTRVVNPSKEKCRQEFKQLLDTDSAHADADFSLMLAFLYAVATGNQDYIVTGPKETLDSHVYVFAAEEARHSSRVVLLDEYLKSLKK